jgi:predicted metalloendopeptidase
VDKAFKEKDKSIANQMVRQVQSAFSRLLKSAEWLGPARSAALSKLNNMFLEVGHPTAWLKFAPSVDEKQWFENSVAMSEWQVKTALAKLGTSVKRRAWGDSGPMEVNAAYKQHVNGLFIPAGVLQPPFFSDKYPEGWNFGGVGVLMGHEMTHGFDDQGRHFDDKGKLSDWWTKAVQIKYNKRAQCIASYYSSFKVFGKPVNGNLTLGENIADNGGIRLAWEAMQHALGHLETLSAQRRKLIHATAAKQFFLSWAQTWCSKTSKKASLIDLATDVHAPNSVRVNAPLSQFPEFATTFGCKAGTKMNPKSPRCRLW